MWRSCALSLLVANAFAPVCGVLRLKGPRHDDRRTDVWHLYSNETAAKIGKDRLQLAFDLAYQSFNKSFDFKAYEHFRSEFEEGLQRYRGTDAYAGYEYYPHRPHCDKGVAGAPRGSGINGIAAFPGGITQRAFGIDFAKTMDQMSQKANGPASAGLVMPQAMLKQGLSMGAGMVQNLIATLIHVVPPLIPPPVWNNMPLVCMPMVTGHNCFGAVLYLITAADFAIADVTDSMLDGVIAGFPNTYAAKVGKTSDAMYKACFGSYMSMHCSSIFPRCSVPQAREEPTPAGRLPLCLHLCIIPLVMCPGFWIGDIIGTCTMLGTPPLCTQAFYWNMWKLPPQYANFDEANPFPKECPKSDTSAFGLDAAESPSLFDAVSAPPSAILREAAAVKGPKVSV